MKKPRTIIHEGKEYKLPPGIYYLRGKFQARINIAKGKTKTIGNYPNLSEAKTALKRASKNKVIENVKTLENEFYQWQCVGCGEKFIDETMPRPCSKCGAIADMRHL